MGEVWTVGDMSAVGLGAGSGGLEGTVPGGKGMGVRRAKWIKKNYRGKNKSHPLDFPQ